MQNIQIFKGVFTEAFGWTSIKIQARSQTYVLVFQALILNHVLCLHSEVCFGTVSSVRKYDRESNTEVMRSGAVFLREGELL